MRRTFRSFHGEYDVTTDDGMTRHTSIEDVIIEELMAGDKDPARLVRDTGLTLSQVAAAGGRLAKKRIIGRNHWAWCLK